MTLSFGSGDSYKKPRVSGAIRYGMTVNRQHVPNLDNKMIGKQIPGLECIINKASKPESGQGPRS